jgi:hypothetical protein
MLLPITERGRESRYLMWGAIHEKDMNMLLLGLDAVHIYCQTADIGVKTIDRRARRISLKGAPPIDSSAKLYKLTHGGNVLHIDIK